MIYMKKIINKKNIVITTLALIAFMLYVSALLLANELSIKQQTINTLQNKVNEQSIEILEFEKDHEADQTVNERYNQSTSLGMFEITAYCPCSKCSSSWNRTTSTGTIATSNRTVAVNPSVIPYGTHLNINGMEYVAEDTGGAMREKPHLIDVFMESHEEALIFGRQKAEVFILE